MARRCVGKALRERFAASLGQEPWRGCCTFVQRRRVALSSSLNQSMDLMQTSYGFSGTCWLNFQGKLAVEMVQILKVLTELALITSRPIVIAEAVSVIEV